MVTTHGMSAMSEAGVYLCTCATCRQSETAHQHGGSGFEMNSNLQNIEVGNADKDASEIRYWPLYTPRTLWPYTSWNWSLQPCITSVNQNHQCLDAHSSLNVASSQLPSRDSHPLVADVKIGVKLDNPRSCHINQLEVKFSQELSGRAAC